jgi:hypothetical protein
LELKSKVRDMKGLPVEYSKEGPLEHLNASLLMYCRSLVPKSSAQWLFVKGVLLGFTGVVLPPSIVVRPEMLEHGVEVDIV